jgi:hypothetical protein
VRLDVRLASRSASSLALISECGTCIGRRMKFVNTPELPTICLDGVEGRFGNVHLSFDREKSRRLCVQSQFRYERNRLWSLPEMIDGQVITLCSIIQQLQSRIGWWEKFPNHEVDVLKEEKAITAQMTCLHQIVQLEPIHKDGDLTWRVNKFINELQHNDPFSAFSLIREFRNFHDQLLRAVGAHKFAYIPQADVPFFEQNHLFGERVYDKFPEIRDEIKDIGNSYAAGLYSACVYHAMRVSEFGLRKVAHRLKVKLRDNRKPLPVSYATWDKLINAIKSKLNEIRQSPEGKFAGTRTTTLF